MKIKEVKLNEYDWMNIFRGVNDYGGASLRRGNVGTTSGRLTQEIFIKDFMNDAVTGLESAIKSGLVNINQTSTQATDTATQPEQPATQPQTAPTGSSLNYRNAVKAMRKRGMQVGETKLSHYDKLNFLFEAIVEEETQENGETIDSWLTKFFNRYMRNVDLTGKEAFIKTKANEVASAIQQSKGNVRAPGVLKSLQQLANLGYSLSLANAGASKAPAQVSQRATVQQPQQTTVQQPQQTTVQQPQQTTVQQPQQTKAAEPTVAQQVSKATIQDVSAALQSLGYKAKEIKQVLPNLTPGQSIDDSLRQALVLIQQGTLARPKTVKRTNNFKLPNKSDDLAGLTLQAMEKLEKTDPAVLKDLLSIIQQDFSQHNYNDKLRATGSNVINLRNPK